MSSWPNNRTPLQARAPAGWHDIEGPAKALRVLVVLTIVSLGLLVIAYAVDHSASTSYDVGDGSLQTVRNAEAFLGFASVVSGGLTIAVFVLTIVWQWRLAKNHEQLGRLGTSLGPGWAIGGWFIPLANFVLPFIQFRELWLGSDPQASPQSYAWKQGRVGPVLWLWWAFFAAAYAIEFATSYQIALGTVTTRDQSIGGPIAASLFRMVAGVFFIVVIQRLTERQGQAITGTLEAQSPSGWAPAIPVPPPADLRPGWKPDPTGRGAYRYWDGIRWTEHAAIEGRTFSSPMR